MSEPHVEKQPPVPPFVQFCCAAVPMVFDDSLSYYEAVCALWKYVDGMTKVINNNALITEDYIAKVEELKSYVEHYFDNLDVQDEINNKLDEMAESGELEELIIGYFQEQQVSYEMFGAKGDGVTDDYQAIKDTHDYANLHNLKVVGLPEKVYYVKNITAPVEIKTDVDWQNCKIVIDDSDAGLNNVNLFTIPGNDEINVINQVSVSLDKNSTTTGITNHGMCIGYIKNINKKDFIRGGANPDSGTDRTEYFVVDNEGNLLTPLYFDFNVITNAVVKPIENTNLTIKNGRFETVCNSIDSTNYISRGIFISRSNTFVENIVHTISGEDDAEHSSPYVGFIYTNFAYNVHINNCVLSSHKAFTTTGSYDINNNGCIKLTINNLRQTNSITSGSLWSLHGSNYCKDVTFNDCVIMNVDAHKGVYNLSVNNCVLGKQIGCVGFGDLIIKNTEVLNYYFVHLREDFGAFWDGNLIIENCQLTSNVSAIKDIVYATNNQDHDFGYKCKLPNIYIDGFKFNNGSYTTSLACLIRFATPSTVANFDDSYEDNVSAGKYPLIFPAHIELHNIKTTGDYFIPTGSLVDFHNCYFEKAGNAVEAATIHEVGKNLEYNYKLIIDNCDISSESRVNGTYSNTNNSVFYVTGIQGIAVTNTHRGIGDIYINNCKYLQLGNQGRMVTYHVDNSTLFLTASGYTKNYGNFIINNTELHCRYNGTTTNRQFAFANYSCKITNSKYYIDDTTFATVANQEYIFIPWATSGNHAFVRYISINNDYGITDADFNTITFYANNKARYLWNPDNYTKTLEFETVNNKVGTSSQRPDYNLMAGVSYFDTTAGAIKTYDGANWV